MAHLSLPNSRLFIGLTAVGTPALEALCAQSDVAVLFPSDSAADVEALATPPRTLVVVDGTWSNARKVVEKCPLLSRLPRLRFTPTTPGNYRIRKEPTDAHYSTIEATAYVLERLERAPGRFSPILSAFDAMVDRQLAFTQRSGGSRHKRKTKRNTVKVDPLAPLKSAPGRVVTVFGEANAWPLDAVDRPEGEPELVQLVAQAIGEEGPGFFALLRPSRPLSPSVPAHLDLPALAITQAERRASALARWARFLQPDDTLVGWGTYCAKLLALEGLRPERFVDLRSLLAQVNRGRPGSVELVAQRLGVALPDGQGRAVRRLAALAVATRAALGLNVDGSPGHHRLDLEVLFR